MVSNNLKARYIPVRTLSEMAGVSVQSLYKAINKNRWRGQNILAVNDPNSGWLIDSSSLPAEIQNQLPAILNDAQIEFNGDLNPASIELAKFRYSVIAPILDTKARSQERSEAVKSAASNNYLYLGKTQNFTRQTLYNWLRGYEAKGMNGLIADTRADKGQKRVLITRKWDSNIDLDFSKKQECAEQIEKYAKSLFSKGTSFRQTARLSSHRLVEISKQLGSQLSHSNLREICKLHTVWCEKFRKYRKIAIRDLDAKKYNDQYEPRIQRKPATRPMEIVYGDVHPVDIYVPSNDKKSQLRVRLIAWVDDATHYMWAFPAIFGKGTGVRQVDVADALYELVTDPHGGLPETLYLDNGGEYLALGNAFDECPAFYGLLQNRGVQKARPYNGSAKALAEGGFKNLEQQIVKFLDGWIGGDRTNMKTHAVGKPVRGFQNGITKLINALHEVVAIYNDLPQEGRLNGRSPREVLAEFLEAGWRPDTLDDDSFDYVVSKRETRDVRQGSIKINKRKYYSDELAKLGADEKVLVRLPLRSSTDKVFIDHAGKRLGEAQPDGYHHPLDKAGAQEQARRSKLTRRAINQLKSDVDRKINVHDEQLRFTNKEPLNDEFGAIIRLNDSQENRATKSHDEVLQDLNAKSERMLLALKSQFPSTTKRRQSNG